MALAMPMYISYRRTACDTTARQDLENLRVAYVRFKNDPNNHDKKAPLRLENLLGSYYGWGGTSWKCETRIKYDHERQEVYAVALRGSEPAGEGTRYIFQLNLSGEVPEWKTKRALFRQEEFAPYTMVGNGRQQSCFDSSGNLLAGCRH